MDDVRMFPLTGCATGTLPDQCALVELSYLPSPLATMAEALTLRLSMTAVQADELAQQLQRAAVAARQRTDRGSTVQ